MKSLLDKVIIMIAGGGDASRFYLPSRKDKCKPMAPKVFCAPLRMHGYSILNESVPYNAFSAEGETYLDIILSVVAGFQSNADSPIPVALITGPNNDKSIRDALQHTGKSDDFDIIVIEQESRPVLTTEGISVFWENGEVMKAPNGTAGCLEALQQSRWFRDRVSDGREFVFVWFGNDISSGSNLVDFVQGLADTDLPVRWYSDARGQEAMERLGQTPNSLRNGELVEALEDAPGAYVVRTSALDEVLAYVEEHVVVKDIPILQADGRLQSGLKRERFLADIVRKSAMMALKRILTRAENLRPGEVLFDRLKVTEIRQTPGGPSYTLVDLSTGSAIEFPTTSCDTKSRQSIASREMLEILMCADLEDGFFTTEIDIGEKEPGEYLVGSYQIQEVRRGAFGVVYICKDLSDGERLAVKTFTDEVRWGHPWAVRQFWQEASCWVLLPPHPNVVEAFEVQEVDGRLHIFMEYVEGQTLRTLLQHKPPSLVEAMGLALQLCGGLCALHENGLIHRDIKPENVFITAEGTAKLSDLGLVMLSSDKQHRRAVGTPGYWAPEQIAMPDAMTNRADVYSLGVVMYEMLTGTQPKSVKELPSHLNAQVTADLDALVMSCLAVEPTARPSAQQLAERLDEMYRRLTGTPFIQLDRLEKTEVSRSKELARINALILLGRAQEAVELCEKHLHVSPVSNDLRYTLALALYELERYRECAAQCVDALRILGEGASEIYRMTDRLLQMCNVWLGAAEGDTSHWESLGWIAAHSQGSSRMGLKCAEIALKLEPQNYTAWHLKGQCLYNLGQYEKSLECYERAAKATNPRVRSLASREGQRCREILNEGALRAFGEQQVVTKGFRLLGKKEFSEAEKCFREALERFPVSLQITIGMGIALKETGRPAEAVEYFDRALHKSNNTSMLWFNKGRALLLQDLFQEALDCFERALRLSPDDAPTYNSKGTCLMAMGRLDEARTCFGDALRIDPDNKVASQGIVWIDRGQSSEQERLFSSSDYWAKRGLEYQEKGHLPQAADCLKMALRLGPNEGFNWYNMGHVLWSLGQHQAALEHCERALAMDPNLVHAWNVRGNALDDLGRTEDALESYDRAICLDDECYEAWNGKGLCLGNLGRHEEALICFDKSCAIQADYSRGWRNKADTLSDLERYDEAVACYDKALAINPCHRGAAANRGSALFHMGKFAEAAESYRREIGNDPTDCNSWANLGSALSMQGEIGEATKCFRQALTICPGFPIAQAKLKWIEHLAGGSSS